MSQYDYNGIVKLINIGLEPGNAGRHNLEDFAKFHEARVAMVKIFNEHKALVEAQAMRDPPRDSQ
jgi:hypothetical protein